MSKCKQPNGPLQFPDDSNIGSDKTQTTASTTGTTIGTSYTVPSTPRMNYGWACPRCDRINAPWKSSCDCSGENWHPTWYPWDYKEPWWKQVTCDSGHPETTFWKVPSSVCTSDSNTFKSDNITAYNVKVDNDIYTGNSGLNIGGSDYWNSITKTWENVPHTLTNMQKELDEIKSTFSKTLRGE